MIAALPDVPYGVEVFNLAGTPDNAATQAYTSGMDARRLPPA